MRFQGAGPFQLEGSSSIGISPGRGFQVQAIGMQLRALFHIYYIRRAFLFGNYFVSRFGHFFWISVSLLASLLFAFLLFPWFWFYASLLLCFSASPLFCFSAFCFSAFLPFPASLLLCFSASLLLYFSTVLLLRCFLLLCFSSKPK